MTPDQIKEAAIAAAYAEFTAQRKNDNTTWRECVEAALDAYEAAMWRPIEAAPLDGTRIIGVTDGGYMCVLSWAVNDGYWRRNLHEEFPDRWNPTHFRPLPQPPVSAAIRAAGEVS